MKKVLKGDYYVRKGKPISAKHALRKSQDAPYFSTSVDKEGNEVLPDHKKVIFGDYADVTI